MTEEELSRLKGLFTELINIMKKYGQYVQKFQFNYLCDIINVIESNLSRADKTSLIIEKYNNLYFPKGGLSEFYIHHSNPEKMREINIPLEDIQDKIWDIVKNYRYIRKL